MSRLEQLLHAMPKVDLGPIDKAAYARTWRDLAVHTRQLEALAARVARLNPDAGEIGAGMLASLVENARSLDPGVSETPSDALPVSSERVSEERALSAMIDWVKAALQCKDWIWDGDQRDAAEFELAEAEKALLALRASVKTVPEALEQLRIAVEAEAADKSRRNELLSTLLVNIEKNEPTAEFAVALRDFVREERPKLSAIEAPAASSEVTEEMVERAAKAMASKDGNLRNWQLYVPDARVALTAALKGE